MVVTSRQHVIQDATRQWLNKHFEGIFEDVLFGNHWCARGRVRARGQEGRLTSRAAGGARHQMHEHW